MLSNTRIYPPCGVNCESSHLKAQTSDNETTIVWGWMRTSRVMIHSDLDKIHDAVIRHLLAAGAVL